VNEEFPIAVRRTAESSEFFDMAARGMLMIRRCLECSAYRAPQVTCCPRCYGEASEPVPADGAASLVSWTVVHRSPVPGLDAPYVAALVECREGPWVFVRLLGTDGSELSAGMALELVTVVTGEDGETLVAARVPEEAR